MRIEFLPVDREGAARGGRKPAEGSANHRDMALRMPNGGEDGSAPTRSRPCHPPINGCVEGETRPAVVEQRATYRWPSSRPRTGGRAASEGERSVETPHRRPSSK